MQRERRGPPRPRTPGSRYPGRFAATAIPAKPGRDPAPVPPVSRRRRRETRATRMPTPKRSPNSSAQPLPVLPSRPPAAGRCGHGRLPPGASPLPESSAAFVHCAVGPGARRGNRDARPRRRVRPAPGTGTSPDTPSGSSPPLAEEPLPASVREEGAGPGAPSPASTGTDREAAETRPSSNDPSRNRSNLPARFETARRSRNGAAPAGGVGPAPSSRRFSPADCPGGISTSRTGPVPRPGRSRVIRSSPVTGGNRRPDSARRTPGRATAEAASGAGTSRGGPRSGAVAPWSPAGPKDRVRSRQGRSFRAGNHPDRSPGRQGVSPGRGRRRRRCGALRRPDW